MTLPENDVKMSGQASNLFGLTGLNLKGRGLVIVAVPLVCQLVVVAVLSLLLWNLQNDLMRESHARDVISTTQQLGGDLSEAMLSVAFYRQAGTGIVDLNACRKEIEAVKNRLAKVISMLESDQSTRPALQKLRDAQHAMDAQLNIIESVQKQGKGVDSIDYRLMIVVKEFHEAMGSVTNAVHARHLEAPKVAGKAPGSIEMWLLFALGGSVCLALLLGRMYTNAIRGPVLRISENGLRLSRMEELLPPLAGSDELSELDQLLHSVASAVSERRTSEQAMINNAADLICSFNDEGVFTKANSSVARVLGYEPHEVIGKLLIELTVAEDSLKADDELRIARMCEDTRVFELRLRKKDCTVIDTRWSALWSVVENSLFCVVQDVTEQKRIERLKQDFLDMISHDLRSPLMSMQSSMWLISEGVKGELPPETKSEVQKVGRDIERLIAFVNDLLDFQKLKAGKMRLDAQSCDFAEVIGEAVSQVEGLARQNELAVEIPSGYWRVNCDRQKLIQTLVNLLSNAIKFSPRGSTIAINVNESPESIEVEVSDCGPGVPEEAGQKIFEAFEQVQGSQKAHLGVGLGLAICKLIVEAHGGSIGVKTRWSEKGNVDVPAAIAGSTFWFVIPKDAGGEKATAQLSQLPIVN